MLNLGLSTSRIEGSQCNKTQEPAHSLHALSTNSNSHQDIVVTTKFSPTSPFLFVSGTVRTHHTFRLPSIHFITKYYKLGDVYLLGKATKFYFVFIFQVACLGKLCGIHLFFKNKRLH